MFMQFLGKILVIGIRIYQISISPLFAPCCRFSPSCSEYAITAIRRYGPFKGLCSGLLRLARCHPFHSGGYDPVK